MREYTIPRNIKVKEGIIYGLNAKQILYMAIGLGGCAGLFMSGWAVPIHIKTAISALMISGCVGFAISKVDGQDLDKYVYNTIKYPLRQKEFGGVAVDFQQKTNVLIARFNTR